MASRVGSPSDRNNAAAGANSTLLTAPDTTGIATWRCYRHLVTFGPDRSMLKRPEVISGFTREGGW